jgi:hypothetical protein
MVPSPAVTTESPRRIAIDELQQLVDDPLSLEARDDADALVPEMATQSFVQAALTLREEGRLELLLPHATAEQLTGLIDLDAWREDRVDVPRAREWLTNIVECMSTPDRARGELTRLMYAMDPEMWTFALIAATAIGELDPEDDGKRQLILEDMASLEIWETPDGLFVVGVPDQEIGRAALRVLRAVYDDSLDEGRRLVNSIKWSLPAEVEEQLLGWRRGRLADMGFPELEDAMRLFSPLSRSAVLGSEQPDTVILVEGPEPPVVWARGSDLLRRVMSRLDDEEYGVRSREFLLLVNELIAAQRLEPGDLQARERALAQAQGTLNLAFELLLADGEHAADAEGFLVDRVTTTGLRRLFRHGYSALAKLRTAAQTLHRHGGISIDRIASLLDRPWGPAVRTLGAWMPELPLGSKKNGTRPIRSAADLAEATRLVEGAAALTSLTFGSTGYAIDPIWLTRLDEPGKLKLGDLVRAAIVRNARAAKGGPTERERLLPLDLDDLAWAKAELLVRGGHLATYVREDFAARCSDVAATRSADALSENLLTRFEVELAAMDLEDGKPDLTKVGGFLTIQQVGLWLKLRAGEAN